jgi:DNA-binding XRE family transcriptional regulator
MTTVAPDNRVREIRKRQDLSSDALAKMVGTSGATIRRHESGDHRAAVAAECEEILELIRVRARRCPYVRRRLRVANHCSRHQSARGEAMSHKEGTLRMMPSGRWAVCRPGAKKFTKGKPPA